MPALKAKVVEENKKPAVEEEKKVVHANSIKAN